MNPPSREIRVLFVPPAPEGGNRRFPCGHPWHPRKLLAVSPSPLYFSPSPHPRHTRAQRPLSVPSRSLVADLILSKSRALNTHSPPLITSNVSSLRDCLRTSLTAQGDETRRRLQAVIREAAVSGCTVHKNTRNDFICISGKQRDCTSYYISNKIPFYHTSTLISLRHAKFALAFQLIYTSFNFQTIVLQTCWKITRINFTH